MNNYFDIYFSVAHGLEIDFPFFGMTVSTSAIVVVTLVVVALRVRKVLRDRKRVAVRQTVANDFDFDWSAN